MPLRGCHCVRAVSVRCVTLMSASDRRRTGEPTVGIWCGTTEWKGGSVVEEEAVRFTNPDKVLYPATGTTKGEVIDYYRRVSGVMLPGLAGRPVTRKRWPGGVGVAPFFTKDLD